MIIKRTLSVLLSVMIVLTVVCGCFAISADAAGTITYSFVIKAADSVNAFEGKIHYPQNALSVNSITFSGQKNDKGGTILFNTSDISNPFDFSEGGNIITVVFNVNGTYDSSQIYGELEEFYNIALIADGNVPFDYSNVIDGEVVSCGHTDIDNPAASYENTKYTIVYSYKNNPAAAADLKYTKSAWSNLTDAELIAELNMPRIKNPYYGSYSVDSAEFNPESSNTIAATLSAATKKYTVDVDGENQGQYEYLAPATVNTDNEKDFMINGVRVATGTSYTFFVTSNIDITTEEPSGEIGENASVINNALYLSDDSQNIARVNMEMLASATSTDFERMGIAFAASSRDTSDIQSAVNAVTGADTALSNKIAVHNSKVDNPNVSGQYQFIYAPYITVSKVSKDKSLYFYAFVVNKDGTVTVSDPAEIAFANILA